MIRYNSSDVIEVTARVHLDDIPNVGWHQPFEVMDENGVVREAVLQSVGSDGSDILVKLS